MHYYIEIFRQYIESHAWVVRPLFALAGALAFNYAGYFLYRRVHTKLFASHHFIINALLEAIHSPLIVLVWTEAIAFAWTTTGKLGPDVLQVVKTLRAVGLILLLAWVLVRFIKLFEGLLLRGAITSRTPDKTIVQATGKLLRVAAVVVVALCMLPVLGISVSGIVAFGGGSAIVVGIAAQQILANYFGGLLIYFDGSFRVGDWIYSPDKSIEGVVEYIGWRSTQIRNFDKRPLYVPNAVFSSIIVVNGSRMTNRRIRQDFGIRYADAATLVHITQDVQEMLAAHPGIDQAQNVMAHFTEFGPSSFKINVSACTRTTVLREYRDIQQEVFLNIIRIVEKNGASLAIPANAVYVNRHDKEK